MHLELKGVDVGDRWLDLLLYLLPHIHLHISPLADLHLLYELAHADQLEPVSLMLKSIQAQTQRRNLWAEVVLLTANGILAYATGDCKTAAPELEEVLPQLHQVGGSHTQRAIFKEIYANARSGQGANQSAAATCLKICCLTIVVSNPTNSTTSTIRPKSTIATFKLHFEGTELAQSGAVQSFSYSAAAV